MVSYHPLSYTFFLFLHLEKNSKESFHFVIYYLNKLGGEEKKTVYLTFGSFIFLNTKKLENASKSLVLL